MDGGRLSKTAVMAFSGGMDSTGLLMHLIANDYTVHTLSYDYGQKHKIELDRAKANIQYLADNNIQVSHKIVDLQSAMSVFHSALTTKNYEIPEGHYEEEQMKQTVVPNRNAIFASNLHPKESCPKEWQPLHPPVLIQNAFFEKLINPD